MCPHCQLVYYCCEDHFNLHKYQDYCLPYKAGRIPEKGRVLFATRDIKPLELLLVDPGTVVGPNYKSEPVCLQCLRSVTNGNRCEVCRYPVCSETCAAGSRHAAECKYLAENTELAETIRPEELNVAYAHVTILRMLLLMKNGGDNWFRTNQLMDHLECSGVNPQEWTWYNQTVIKYIRNCLKLGQMFSDDQIRHVIGLLNVNAVCLQFPKMIGAPCTEVGKGCYPIFAIMSHHCICNARYFVDPSNFNMFVRARVAIKAGEEITVQYLSALKGTHRRRKKICDEWYFDCNCRRCSDPSECGTNISGVKCLQCHTGCMLPLNPLDYFSAWRCNKCGAEAGCDKIEKIVSHVESELNEITNSGQFEDYKLFIKDYSGVILHKNHFLLTTAKRNLMQFYCYSVSVQDVAKQEDLEFKLQLCQDFHDVLMKIDPGWSELAMFAKRELHFYKLSLLQRDFALGLLPFCEFSVKSRNSIDTLKLIDSQKKMLLSFDK